MLDLTPRKIRKREKTTMFSLSLKKMTCPKVDASTARRIHLSATFRDDAHDGPRAVFLLAGNNEIIPFAPQYHAPTRDEFGSPTWRPTKEGVFVPPPTSVKFPSCT